MSAILARLRTVHRRSHNFRALGVADEPMRCPRWANVPAGYKGIPLVQMVPCKRNISRLRYVLVGACKQCRGGA